MFKNLITNSANTTKKIHQQFLLRMPVVEKFCGCCSLRRGGIILGYLDLINSLGWIIFIIFQVPKIDNEFDPTRQEVKYIKACKFGMVSEFMYM